MNEWTSLGLTKEQLQKLSKTRAYLEYMTGVRYSLGDVVLMAQGVILGFLSTVERLDKDEINKQDREILEKQIGHIWMKFFIDYLHARENKDTWSLAIDTLQKSLESL